MNNIDFKHVIIFDSEDMDSHIRLSNKPDNIEDLLNNSPVIANINNHDTLVGVITNVQNRSRTSLYYGNIFIQDKYSQFKNIKIVKHSICYREPPVNGIYDAINIVTYIEKI